MSTVQLLARVMITGEIETLTGLHIGGSPGALAIGNVDMPVIRNLLNGHPYIPGSSLKGKMRSLSEKYTGAPQKGDGSKRVRIHTAESAEEYQKYWVNPIFGVPGDAGSWVTLPGRLIVRDIPLEKKSEEKLRSKRTDMPYTEVKWEAAIDRVTSAATPRQIERVPAGTVFGPVELVFSLYCPEDTTLLGHLLTAMQLVEDDYLGGQGSRGSGKIAFRKLTVEVRTGRDYRTVKNKRFTEVNLSTLMECRDELKDWVSSCLAG